MEFPETVTYNVTYNRGLNFYAELDVSNGRVAAALAKIVHKRIPSMAIEFIYIEENTSILEDHHLANALGHIPIFANPLMFEMVEGENDLDETNSIKFTLDIEAPEDYTRNLGERYSTEVFARDLVCHQPPNKVGLPSMLLTRMYPGDRIKLTAYAVRNTGSRHVRFRPAHHILINRVRKVEFNYNVYGKQAEVLRQSCPMSVFDIEETNILEDENDPDSKIRVATIKNGGKDCNACMLCTQPLGISGVPTKAVILRDSPDTYIFSMESIGGIPPLKIFKMAIEVFQVKYKTKFVDRKDV